MSEPRELEGCRIVVTRAADQGDGLAAQLGARGGSVRVRPLVAVAPPADGGPLRSALAALASYDWVAFTSANAVRAAAQAAPAGSCWPPVACVGPGTARAAFAAGLPVALVPEVFSGAALAAALTALPLPLAARVLWPRASVAREAFSEALRAAGYRVDEVECYRTVPSKAAARALHEELRKVPADVLLFTSPAALRTLAAVTGGAPPGAVAVIGTVTASAAEEVGWPVAVLATEQSLAGLVAGIVRWWSGQSTT